MLGSTNEEQSSSLFPTRKSMLTSIKNNRAELLFLASMTIATIYFIHATVSLTRPDSAAVPWVILLIMTVSLVLIYATILVGDRLKQMFGSEDDDWMNIDTNDFASEDGNEDDQVMFEINLWGVMKELAWITGYILGIVFIGFFISTIVFVNAYIFLKEQSNIKRRLAYQAIWTTSILLILYVLFIQLLRVGAIFRLGFLP